MDKILGVKDLRTQQAVNLNLKEAIVAAKLPNALQGINAKSLRL
jgi:hypothetical protein